MNELFISLPDGKTELPAKLIVDKLGKLVKLSVTTEFRLSSTPDELEKSKNAIIDSIEVSP